MAPSNREGDNLFTCSLVAVNVDTGKLAWYYQTSPHDTHDWDSAQTPVLVDGEFNGKPRKLVLQAARNGHFFVLDRVTGEHLLTSRFTPWGKWVEGSQRERPADPRSGSRSPRGRHHREPGWLGQLAAAGLQPADRPVLFPRLRELRHCYYFTETDPRGAMGMGGVARGGQVSLGTIIRAIDYKTGKIVWERPFETGVGLIGRNRLGLVDDRRQPAVRRGPG